MSWQKSFQNFFSRFCEDTAERSNLPRGGIALESVSKRFRKRTIIKKGYTTIKSSLLAGSRQNRRTEPNYTVALDQVSIEVSPGSSLGVIGRNGSGKSTLLKLISGIYLPDSGRVRVNGNISALIELGAGFHPDFTGRENIYLGGIMYGLKRSEIDSRFDDIVRYAELEQFIDDPVKTYSSGMYMRLGFSLAIHTDPDILLIDEVLAVGDAAFIYRCQDTISEFKRQGKTLVFVTHDLNAVARWCDEAIWLDRGVVRERGNPRWVIDAYLQHVRLDEQQELASSNLSQGASEGFSRAEEVDQHSVWKEARAPSSTEEKRWGNRDVEIGEVRMLDAQRTPQWVFSDDESVCIEVEYRINRPVRDLVFGIGFLRADGLEVHGSNTDLEDVSVPLPASEEDGDYPLQGIYRYRIQRLGLLENSYYLDVAAHREDGFPFDYHHRLHKFSVRSKAKNTGVFNPEHVWEFDVDYPVAESSNTMTEGARKKVAKV